MSLSIESSTIIVLVYAVDLCGDFQLLLWKIIMEKTSGERTVKRRWILPDSNGSELVNNAQKTGLKFDKIITKNILNFLWIML